MIFKKIYHKIPINFRHQTTTLIWNCYHQLKKFVEPIYPQVFIFKGLEKNTQTPLTFAYVGSPSQTQEYWAQTVLSPGFEKKILGRKFCTSIIPQLIKLSMDCHFILIECNPLTLYYFSKKPGFHIPRWVNMELDISLPIQKLFGNQRPEIQRKIKKNHLTYELTKEQKYLDDFYHNMYLPYIKTRYKGTAMLNVHQTMIEILNNGELLLIKKDGAVIAGGLLEFRNKNASFRMLGIRDGNSQFVYLGAIGALYYFITIEMQKRGYKKIQIGGTRPLLSDGVTKFKKSLKANLVPHDSNARVWLKLLKDSPSLQSFLTNNPFIFYKKNTRPSRAVFIEAKENCSQQELNDTLGISACNGVEETDLFIFKNIKNHAHYAGLLLKPNLSIRSAKELFSD